MKEKLLCDRRDVSKIVNHINILEKSLKMNGIEMGYTIYDHLENNHHFEKKCFKLYESL